MSPSGGARGAAVACLGALATALLLAACGGGSRQDAGEPKRSFSMRVLRASFPRTQAVSRPATFELEVRNTSARAVPNVAVTIDSFDYNSHYAHLGDTRRPIWAIERGPGKKAEPPVETEEVSIPGNGQTAYVNTWALGRLAAGQTRTFSWKVVAVKAGRHTVSYTLAAGLAGRAKLAHRSHTGGSFAVEIAPAPPRSHVNPSTGKVEPGAYVPGSSS